MRQLPVTSPTLLLRLRDGSNQHAWDQCVQVYLPLIIGFCRQQGLQEADAKDVAQEVLLTLFSTRQRFDYSRAKGRFRSWILAVTRNKLADYFRRLNRHNEACGQAALDQEIDAPRFPEPSADWEQEHRRRLVRWAISRVRHEFGVNTSRAFVETALHGRPPEVVAEELGVSPGAVYVARSRLLARLRELVSSVDQEVADRMFSSAR